MLALLGKLRRDRRGSSMVEFALILPIIIMLGVGVWEFGRIYDASLVATNAAREGARWAARGHDQAEVTQRVTDYLCSGYQGQNAKGQATDRLAGCPTSTSDEITLGTIVMAPTSVAPGDSVQVTVPVTVKIYIPLPGFLNLGSTIVLTRQATMRVQVATGGAG